MPDSSPGNDPIDRIAAFVSGRFGDAMVAAALIDRLVHHATMITLKGKSYRLRERGLSGGHCFKAGSVVHFSAPENGALFGAA